jgi:hypothetical protein
MIVRDDYKIINRYFIRFFSLDIVLMSSLPVSHSVEDILLPIANVKFSRIALKSGGKKSAQVCLNFYVLII